MQGVQLLGYSSSSPGTDHLQDLSCSTDSINAIVSKGASSTDVSSAVGVHLCIQLSTLSDKQKYDPRTKGRN